MALKDLKKLERLALLIALIGGLVALLMQQFIIAGGSTIIGFILMAVQADRDGRKVTKLEAAGIAIALIAGGTLLIHGSFMLSMGGAAIGLLLWFVQKDLNAPPLAPANKPK